MSNSKWQGAEQRRSVAGGTCRGTPETRIGERNHRSHRYRYGRGAAKMQATARSDRGSAHGRDECGGGSVWLGQNVSVASSEERVGDVESCRLSDAVYGGG